MFSAAIIKDENSSLQMVKVFTEMGVKPNFLDSLNQTPLFYAAREGHN
jgi:ankyrin repeat protein